MSAELPVRHRGASSISSIGATSTRASSRCTGASTTAPPWPKPKSNTRTTPAPPLGAVRPSTRSRRHPSGARRPRVYGLIWTTTPWTMPANMAIAFHPEVEYVAVAATTRPADVYIVAAELAEVTAQKCGWHLPGARRRPRRAARTRRLPPSLPRRESSASSPITSPSTGHRRRPHRSRPRPGGLRHRPQYGIETTAPWTPPAASITPAPAACPKSSTARPSGKPTPSSSKSSSSRGALLGTETLEHSYPHCWRCHKPGHLPRHRAVVHRHGAQRSATANLRSGARRHPQRPLDPAWGEERISNMIATRPDWCISRQRVWGVPIIVFYCESCSEPLTDRAINRAIVSLFARRPPTPGTAHPPRRSCPPGHRLRSLRRRRLPQRNRHPRRLVRFRLQPPGRAQ